MCSKMELIELYGLPVELYRDTCTRRWHIGHCGPSYATRREAIREARRRVFAMLEEWGLAQYQQQQGR